MQYEKSCGFVVCDSSGVPPRYLLIRSVNGGWGFPKGHMEPGETELETAVRELWEETGMQVQRVDGFRREIAYPLPGNPAIIKNCVFFLGIARDDAVTAQPSEVSEAGFLPLQEALERLPFEMTKSILRDADAFAHAERKETGKWNIE